MKMEEEKTRGKREDRCAGKMDDEEEDGRWKIVTPLA
jgi:hypothetical protein